MVSHEDSFDIEAKGNLDISWRHQKLYNANDTRRSRNWFPGRFVYRAVKVVVHPWLDSIPNVTDTLFWTRFVTTQIKTRKFFHHWGWWIVFFVINSLFTLPRNSVESFVLIIICPKDNDILWRRTEGIGFICSWVKMQKISWYSIIN